MSNNNRIWRDGLCALSMECEDGGSMTPPCSPFPHIIVADEDIIAPPHDARLRSSIGRAVCFVCDSCHKTTHPESFLQNGHLENLLAVHSGTPDQVLDCSAVNAFGHQITPLFFSSPRQTDILFALAQQRICQLEQLSDLGARSHFNIPRDHNEVGLDVRRNMRILLNTVNAFLLSNINTDNDSPIDHLIQKIYNLLLQCSPISFYTHTKLEVNIGCMELLHLISIKTPRTSWPRHQLFGRDEEDWSADRDAVTQVAELLLRQTINNVAGKLGKLQGSMDWARQSPWSCSCLQETLIWTLHLLQQRQRTAACPSFSVVLMQQLQSVIEPHIDEEDLTEPDSTCVIGGLLGQIVGLSGRLGLCWWVLLHSAHLHLYTSRGLLQEQVPPQSSNHTFLCFLLGKSLTQGEGDLRHYLHCAVKLSTMWEPSTSALTVLLPHFLAKLNEHFLIVGNSLPSFICPKVTVGGMLDRCKSYVAGKPAQTATSYELFLCLLAVELGKIDQRGSSHPLWRQIKSRVYIKLTSRRVSELNDAGVNHLTSLFIVLAQTADFHDCSSKLVELLDQVQMCGGGRQETVWRALFSLAMLHVQNHHNIGFLADRLVTSCSQVVDCNRDRAEQWSCLQLYMDSTLACIESSEMLAEQEHLLIGPCFHQLLQNSHGGELHAVLDFTLHVLNKLRCVAALGMSPDAAVHSQHTAMGNALWQHFYTPVCELACRPSRSPDLLAEVTAAFINLASHCCRGRPSHRSPTECFHFFVFNDQVNARLACRVLVLVWGDKEVLSQLDVTQLGVQLVQVWLRCALYLPLSSDDLLQLNRVMQQVPCVIELLRQSEMEVDREPLTPVLFFTALQHILSTKQDLRQRALFMESARPYFSQLVRHVGAILRDINPAPELQQSLFSTCASLVAHCSPLIYTRSKSDSLLPVLLDKLVLPRKQAPQSIASGDRFIHLFVSGMRLLDLKRDPYLSGKLRDIVIHYVGRFSQMALEDSCERDVRPEASFLRQYVVKVIITEMLNIAPGKTQPHSQQAFAFIHQLFCNTENHTQTAMSVDFLLIACLKHILYSELAPVRGLARQCLAISLKAFSSSPPAKPSFENVQTILAGFVRETLPVELGNVMTALDVVADVFPRLLLALIPVLTQCVKQTEKKRGVGVDRQLRGAYCNVLARLGEKGQEEKSAILRETL